MIFTGLCGVTFQKIEPFIVAVMRTSNPTCRICQKTEMKRPLGRTKHRWQENIKKLVYAGLDWIHVAEGTEQCRLLWAQK
jgi:hypothetical protein